MKKFLFLLLAVMLSFVFVACDDGVFDPSLLLPSEEPEVTEPEVLDHKGGITFYLNGARGEYSANYVKLPLPKNNEELEIIFEIAEMLLMTSEGPEGEPFFDRFEVDGKTYTIQEMLEYDFTEPTAIKLLWTDKLEVEIDMNGTIFQFFEAASITFTADMYYEFIDGSPFMFMLEFYNNLLFQIVESIFEEYILVPEDKPYLMEIEINGVPMRLYEILHNEIMFFTGSNSFKIIWTDIEPIDIFVEDVDLSYVIFADSLESLSVELAAVEDFFDGNTELIGWKCKIVDETNETEEWINLDDITEAQFENIKKVVALYEEILPPDGELPVPPAL